MEELGEIQGLSYQKIMEIISLLLSLSIKFLCQYLTPKFLLLIEQFS